ncbi:hypothetical protein HaLaN_09961 [Haematococcus lacustris]|uniref:Uncharacterized protein n=1 Tax=Haematococcus lacustris TaxID=44745 RepID=A0A699YW87_HAELA|nr:hypothetical protein HaLaN_09961 [Haematococcus lacustris]
MARRSQSPSHIPYASLNTPPAVSSPDAALPCRSSRQRCLMWPWCATTGRPSPCRSCCATSRRLWIAPGSRPGSIGMWALGPQQEPASQQGPEQLPLH